MAMMRAMIKEIRNHSAGLKGYIRFCEERSSLEYNRFLRLIKLEAEEMISEIETDRVIDMIYSAQDQEMEKLGESILNNWWQKYLGNGYNKKNSKRRS